MHRIKQKLNFQTIFVTGSNRELNWLEASQVEEVATTIKNSPGDNPDAKICIKSWSCLK